MQISVKNDNSLPLAPPRKPTNSVWLKIQGGQALPNCQTHGGPRHLRSGRLFLVLPTKAGQADLFIVSWTPRTARGT